MARRMASELVPGTDVGQNHEGDNLTDLYLDHVLLPIRDGVMLIHKANHKG